MDHIIFSTFDNYKKSAPGGTEIAIQETAKRLVNKYKVTIITSKNPQSTDGLLDGVMYRHIGLPFGHQRIKKVVFLLVLPFYVHHLDYKVWIEAFTPPFTTSFLPLFTKRPVVGVTHLFSNKKEKEQHKVFLKKIEKLGLRLYKHIIVLSEYQEKNIHEILPELKVCIIPNGVETKLFTFKRKPEEYLLYMGRIHIYQKGLDFLLEALEKIIHNNQQRVPFYIAGRGEALDEKKIHLIVANKKIDKNIEFLGHLSGKKKEQVLVGAKIFLHTSRSETFGISILEALAVGIPTIVFDIPGLSWIPNDCIVKIPAYDTQKYAEAITNLLNDREKREQLSLRAREFARNYTWDNVANQYDNYLQSLL